jgi:hypothetical protein
MIANADDRDIVVVCPRLLHDVDVAAAGSYLDRDGSVAMRKLVTNM